MSTAGSLDVPEPQLLSRTEGGRSLPLLAWRLPAARRAASTASAGGGIGDRYWVINAQVGHDYGRHDLERHADELARAASLSGTGITMFTAARVSGCRRGEDGGVTAWATVGLTDPTWAAAVQAAPQPSRPGTINPGTINPGTINPGTINIVASVPVALSDAALLNALCTATEAKCQALAEHGVAGTGTPSDAVTIVCAPSGPSEPFCGPRSRWGAPLARAVHAAVRAGVG